MKASLSLDAWRTFGVAVLVSALVAAALAVGLQANVARSFGDPDDAMRLVVVRDLIDGRAGWFDRVVARLQPPWGGELHWSRLFDAGLGGLILALRPLSGPAGAESLARIIWPSLWLVPAVWAVLDISRRLGGWPAAWLAVLMLGANLVLFTQFAPGRLDHHHAQIAMALVALAGAVRGDRTGAIVAGLATAFGLAVGLEALAVLALPGALFALRFGLSATDDGREARAYAVTLAAALSLVYAAEIAPRQWSRTACDALALNLWAAIATACVGLPVVVSLGRGRSTAARLLGLGLVGAAALATYLVLDPACLGGPLGAVDPRIRPIWLDHVVEMQPLLAGFPGKDPGFALSVVVLVALGLAGWAALGRNVEGRTTAWGILGAALLLGSAQGLAAVRMASYPAWIAVPLAAAGLWATASRLPRYRAVVAAAVVLLLSSLAVTAILPARPAANGDGAWCGEFAAYQRLARLPAGLTLGEIGLGPNVLALTPHSALSAPYHRMSQGIVAANQALAAPPGLDEGRVRALGVTYVLTCPARRASFDHRLGRESLQQRLDAGQVPSWLEAVSPPSEPLQVYRVRQSLR